MNHKALLFASLTVLLTTGAHAQSQQAINQCLQTQCNRIIVNTDNAILECMATGRFENDCITLIRPSAISAMRQCEATCQGN